MGLFPEGRKRRVLATLATLVALYVVISYLILPATWARIEHEPGLAKHAFLTATAQGIPGGPINVGLVGTREDLIRAFHAAGWYPADPGINYDQVYERNVGLGSKLGISARAESVGSVGGIQCAPPIPKVGV